MMAETQTTGQTNGASGNGRADGLDKVGALMIALGAERSAAILSRLPEEEIERVVLAVANLPSIDDATRESVLSEFEHGYGTNESGAAGGLGFAESILGKALGTDDASRMRERLQEESEGGDGSQYPFLSSVEHEQLAAVLADEHPQIIAAALAHTPPQKAGAALGELPAELQLDVAERIARSRPVPREVLREVDRSLQDKAGRLRREKGPSGPKCLGDLLSFADRSTERTVLERLDSALAQEVRRLMFLFEDLPKLEGVQLQGVLREAGSKDLALACMGADESLRELIFQNISERAAEALKEDMGLLERVPPEEVDSAQQRVAALVRQMIQDGQIRLPEEDRD
jgi:flagellar motor switch protein FliG